MAGHFQLFGSNGGEWQIVKSFNNPEDLALAQSKADLLLENGLFRKAMVLEATAGDPKAKFKPVYRKSLNAKNPQKFERLELVINKGLTGEWIVIPEKYAKRYKYFGVYGFLCWLYFILIVGPVFSVIASFNNYGEAFPTDNIPYYISFAVVCVVNWGLAWSLWKIKRRAATFAITYFSVFSIVTLLGGDLISFGKSIVVLTYLLFSRRVNAIYRHRLRRGDLEYTVPLKKLESAKFISAKNRKAA